MLRIRLAIRKVLVKILDHFGYYVFGKPGKQFFIGRKDEKNTQHVVVGSLSPLFQSPS
jgi:hypothetical protein